MVDADLPGSGPTWVLATCGLALLGAAVASVVGGPVLGVVAGAVCGSGPWALVRGRRGRAGAVSDAALPVALEAVASGLRAGSTLPLALAAAATGAGPALGAELTRVVADATHVGLAAAADEWALRQPRPAVRLAAAALALSAEVGGAGARALDGVALTLRQRSEAVAEVRALATQARLSALILSVAPIGFVALAGTADPRTVRFLLADPAGQVCLVLGLLLDVAGAAWMGRITRAGAV